MADDVQRYPLAFEGADHALRAGYLMGILMNHGIKTEPVVDKNGNYTNRFKIIDVDTLEEPEELILEVALIPRVIETKMTE